MKVEVNSQALADAVAWTTRVIDARPASPILARRMCENPQDEFPQYSYSR